MGNLRHLRWSLCGFKAHFHSGHWQDNELFFKQLKGRTKYNHGRWLLYSSTSLAGSPVPLSLTEVSCPFPEVCLRLGKGLSLRELILHKIEENRAAAVNSEG